MGSFCLPLFQSKDGEHCILLVLGEFRVPVSKLVKVVLHVGKEAKFRVEKVNDGQNIRNRVASVGNGKNFVKQAQSSKGYQSNIVMNLLY